MMPMAFSQGMFASVFVDGGPSPRHVASTIVDLSEDAGWRLLREGAVPRQQIADLLGE